jgi:hypothetical protein
MGHPSSWQGKFLKFGSHTPSWASWAWLDLPIVIGLQIHPELRGKAKISAETRDMSSLNISMVVYGFQFDCVFGVPNK